MCAVIGVISDQRVDEQILIELFTQSQIRGKHATGISFIDRKNELITNCKSIPSKEFINEFDFSVLPDKLRLIGHCRYSTSDLFYNQPLFSKVSALVHNGVITQQFPDKWKQHYGYDCETKNDSELLLKCLDNKEDPFLKFKGSSISSIYLNNGNVSFFRNGNRPLWYAKFLGIILISSTKNIIERTFENLSINNVIINSCEVGVVYSIGNDLTITKIKISEEKENQIKFNSPSFYKKVSI